MFASLRKLWTPRKRLWLPQDRAGAFRFTPGRCCGCGCSGCCIWNEAGYLVDMGAGGWTDRTCGNCDEFQGVYVLDDHTPDDFLGPCVHRYGEAFFFPIDDPVCKGFNAQLDVWTIIGDDCSIQLWFNYSNTATLSRVVYEISSPACNGPWTLAKSEETHFQNSACTETPNGTPSFDGCQVCSGTMPATIMVTKIV